MKQGEQEILVKMLTEDEGYEEFPYDDATGQPVIAPIGNLTIGIGINLQETGISYDEAVYLLLNRIKRFEEKLLQFNFFENLDIVRRCVLFNMCFNLGYFGLCKFKDMLEAVAAKDYRRAGDEILNSKAARQLPRRYARLASMMRTGTIVR